jgi:hypothetical protein
MRHPLSTSRSGSFVTPVADVVDQEPAQQFDKRSVSARSKLRPNPQAANGISVMS